MTGQCFLKGELTLSEVFVFIAKDKVPRLKYCRGEIISVQNKHTGYLTQGAIDTQSRM